MTLTTVWATVQRFIEDHPDYQIQEYRGHVIVTGSVPVEGGFRGVYLILSPEFWEANTV